MQSPLYEITELSNTFKALSDETRVRIVRLLLHAQSGLCVCELVSALQLPQYQVSRHLSVLKSSGIATVERRGTWSYYGLEPSLVDTPLGTSLYDILSNITGEFADDTVRLDKRLSLRSGGLCVVGFSDTVVAHENAGESS